MYCINCGNQLPDEANFCSHCGKRVMPKVSECSPNAQFSYSDLVSYEFDNVDTLETTFDKKKAFILVEKKGKVGLYNEFFDKELIDCYYDDITVSKRNGLIEFSLHKGGDVSFIALRDNEL